MRKGDTKPWPFGPGRRRCNRILHLSDAVPGILDGPSSLLDRGRRGRLAVAVRDRRTTGTLAGCALIDPTRSSHSTETSFNVPSATTTATNIGLSFRSSNPALTALPIPYSSAISIASERSIPDALKLTTSAFSFPSRPATGVTTPSAVDASIVPVHILLC